MGRDWQNEFLGFSFEDTWVLALIPLLLLIWWWRWRRPGPALAFASLRPVRDLPRSLRARFANLPLHLFALGLVPLMIALARPQKMRRVVTQSQGIDILLCLDLSGSMHERDMAAGGARTRIEVAKKTAEEFTKARSGDRVGLIGFALYPELVCPMTLDKQALIRFLRPLEAKSKTSEEGRTGIGLGLALCVKRLEKSESKSKVVVLLTDGRETVGAIPPREAGKMAKDAGIRVYSIGIGKGENVGFGYRPVDFSDIEYIAKTTGGAFFEATDEKALEKVFAKIDELERSDLEDPLYVPEEIFFPFLSIAALFLFVSTFLRVLWIVELP